MNFEKFRRTGELSDITVIVDKTEFKLHTFPLFTKSDYFKKALESTSPPYIIRLDNNFPGGAEVFNQLADYFYSIPISIDHKNIVPLRSAACFIECKTLGTLLDKRFDEIFSVARRQYDLGIPLVLLEQCTGEYQEWAQHAHIVGKCLECIVESLARGSGLQLTKSDREIIVRLPIEWIAELIKLCPKESKLAILPFVKHYVTIHVLEQTLPSSFRQDEGEHQSAFTPVIKKDDIPVTTDDEKRVIIDEVVKTLGDTLEQLPLIWLNSLYEKAIELNCQSESLLSSYITQAILHSTEFDDGIDSIPDDVMARLLERVSKYKEDHIKDPQLLTKLSTLIDSYVQQLRQRGALTSEQFVKLASCIPKEKRNSHDSLLLALDEILKDEKSTQLSNTEREELLSQVDFSRVNEETIEACKSNKLIPQQLITDAALALCAKLRKELDEARKHLNLIENQPTKSQPSYTNTSPKYRLREVDSSPRLPTRSRQVDSSPCLPSRSREVNSSSRLPTRSRSFYTSTYTPPRRSSNYSYSKYDPENNLDFILPARYRYGSYLTHRY